MVLLVIVGTSIVSLCYADNKLLLLQRADFSLVLSFWENDSQGEVEGEVGTVGRECVQVKNACAHIPKL